MDNVNIHKGHPLILGAAIAVILTCLLAIGVMTGIVPSPMNRGADKQELTTLPPVDTSANTATRLSEAPAPTTALREPSPTTTTTTRETRTVTRAPAHEPRRLTSNAQSSSSRAAPATGATSSSSSQTYAGSGPAVAPPAPVCSNCGTVTSVRAVTKQADASMIGPAAGALLGGLAGRQIGNGTGKTIATVVGAGAGAAAGTEIERRYKSTTEYVVGVRMNDGSQRSFTYATAPNVQAGSKVRVVDGQLVHD